MLVAQAGVAAEDVVDSRLFLSRIKGSSVR